MVNLLKSVCCRNLLKHAKDEKSSGVASPRLLSPPLLQYSPTSLYLPVSLPRPSPLPLTLLPANSCISRILKRERAK